MGQQRSSSAARAIFLVNCTSPSSLSSGGGSAVSLFLPFFRPSVLFVFNVYPPASLEAPQLVSHLIAPWSNRRNRTTVPNRHTSKERAKMHTDRRNSGGTPGSNNVPTATFTFVRSSSIIFVPAVAFVVTSANEKRDRDRGQRDVLLVGRGSYSRRAPRFLARPGTNYNRARRRRPHSRYRVLQLRRCLLRVLNVASHHGGARRLNTTARRFRYDCRRLPHASSTAMTSTETAADGYNRA